MLASRRAEYACDYILVDRPHRAVVVWLRRRLEPRILATAGRAFVRALTRAFRPAFAAQPPRAVDQAALRTDIDTAFAMCAARHADPRSHQLSLPVVRRAATDSITSQNTSAIRRGSLPLPTDAYQRSPPQQGQHEGVRPRPSASHSVHSQRRGSAFRDLRSSIIAPHRLAHCRPITHRRFLS